MRGAVVPPRARIVLRRTLHDFERAAANLLFRYGVDDLAAALRRVGIRRGDSLLVHSGFRRISGFTGTPRDVLESLLAATGLEGNLLMMSMPYRGSSFDHLRADPVFDVRRTVSEVGLLTEIFRRRPGVLRSLHPTHPVLALGKDAPWLVRDHETAETPCGRGTPFGKLRELGGKVLFFDVPFGTFTFIHHIEDLLAERLPFAVYREDPLPGRVIDDAGTLRVVPTRVFSEEAVRRRRPKVLERRLGRRGLLRRARVGRTRLMLVTCEDATREALAMAEAGEFFHVGCEPPA